MGTRCGDIDPGLLPILAHQGYTIQDMDALMNRQSGLLGLTGYADVRTIEERARSGDEKCRLAMQVCFTVLLPRRASEVNRMRYRIECTAARRHHCFWRCNKNVTS
jgi:acetate kinase